MVRKYGEEAARAYMRELRSRVKPENLKGGGFRNRELAKAASKKGVAKLRELRKKNAKQ